MDGRVNFETPEWDSEEHVLSSLHLSSLDPVGFQSETQASPGREDSQQMSTLAPVTGRAELWGSSEGLGKDFFCTYPIFSSKNILHAF